MKNLAEAAAVAEHLVTANAVIRNVLRIEGPGWFLLCRSRRFRLKENRVIKLSDFVLELRPADSLYVELQQLVKA